MLLAQSSSGLETKTFYQNKAGRQITFERETRCHISSQKRDKPVDQTRSGK